MTVEPFDPLSIRNLGRSIAQELLATTPQPLAGPAFVPRSPHFRGAGVYAIYFTGDFPLYAPIAAMNADGAFDQPIYVGKAVPSGGRKGLNVGSSEESTSMSVRLRQHAVSILEASNLDLSDFYARWLPVAEVWIPLGERVTIEGFVPVWNTVVDGFGSKAAGKGRFAGQRSRWDTLHPGRGHAAALRDREEPVSKIESAIQIALAATSEEEIEQALGDELDGAEF